MSDCCPVYCTVQPRGDDEYALCFQGKQPPALGGLLQTLPAVGVRRGPFNERIPEARQIAELLAGVYFQAFEEYTANMILVTGFPDNPASLPQSLPEDKP